MFTIGDFAKLAQISTHRLRNYDKQGLLQPVHTDEETGYRYYTAEQLGTLNRIIALRGLDLSLDEIRSSLTANISLDQMKEMLEQRQTDLEKEIAHKQNQLQQVQNRLQQIEEESQLPVFEIIVKPLPAYSVASVRELVRHVDEIPFYCRILHPEIHYEIEKIGIEGQAPTINLYHNRDYTETNLDFEACVSVLPSAMKKELNSRVQFRWLKEVPVAATLLYSEDCGSVELALMSLLQWSARAGYRVAGPTREVHHSHIVHGVKNALGHTVVEFQMPLEKMVI
ncbi:MAG: helix-turn-helix domain-containing protein [Chloroflexota bacterium]